MSSTATDAVTDFPTEARVILHGLLKAPELNGKKGVVRSELSSAGRHTVYIEELDKSVGLKPTNLKYEPIALDSLSVKELKLILKFKNKEAEDTAGMEKSDLTSRVSDLIDSPEDLPALLAKAKTSAKPKTTNSSFSAAATAQAAQQLGNMSPEQLRQQARMMRTMDPATVRRMNPQLANMSDAQLKMAADRMEMMANNPSMMKMAMEQMQKMDPGQLQKMQAQMAGGANPAAGTTPGTAPVATPSVSQAQQAAKVMQNMSPEQLRQQAQMLKTMDPDVIRRTNPQMAHMSDAQIKMAATQFEMMASNPAMMKMATEQMANATPEQLEALSKGQVPPGGANAAPGGMGGFANGMGDPAAMLENIDKTQLKELLNTVKDNPEMLKQFAGMAGVSEEQLKVGVESFAGMDDNKIDAVLKLAKVAQKAKTTYDNVDAKVGGNLKSMLVGGLILFNLFIAWYFFFRGKTASPVESAVFEENQYYDAGDSLDSEF